MSSFEFDPAGVAALEQQVQGAIAVVDQKINAMLAERHGDETLEQLTAKAAAILQSHNLQPDQDGIRAMISSVIDQTGSE